VRVRVLYVLAYDHKDSFSKTKTKKNSTKLFVSPPWRVTRETDEGTFSLLYHDEPRQEGAQYGDDNPCRRALPASKGLQAVTTRDKHTCEKRHQASESEGKKT
jgi:hypothetical protein